MKCCCFQKHRNSGRRRGRRKRRERSWGKRVRGPETPLGTAFRCRGRPTAEYCRRAVVMETGRQSRLFIGLYKTSLLPPPLLRSSSLPPPQIPSQDRKPDGNPQVLLPVASHKDGTGGAGAQEVSVRLQHTTVKKSRHRCCSQCAGWPGLLRRTVRMTLQCTTPFWTTCNRRIRSATPQAPARKTQDVKLLVGSKSVKACCSVFAELRSRSNWCIILTLMIM